MLKPIVSVIVLLVLTSPGQAQTERVESNQETMGFSMIDFSLSSLTDRVSGLPAMEYRRFGHSLLCKQL